MVKASPFLWAIDMDKHQRYGVIYKDEDYAGFVPRMAIMAVDSALVLLVTGMGFWADTLLFEGTEYYGSYYLFCASLVIAYLYLTTLKASKYGTLGQRLTATRIETIYGDRPGQLRMTMRLLYWILGPVNSITDIVFMLVVKERRSIRDCFCNTIVVRRGAVPIERNAPVRVARIFALGLNLMYESCNGGYA